MSSPVTPQMQALPRAQLTLNLDDDDDEDELEAAAAGVSGAPLPLVTLEELLSPSTGADAHKGAAAQASETH